MRKRLRKKKHVGEFQELGVELSVRLRPGTDYDRFLDDFIENAVEARGLCFGGGAWNLTVDGYVELGRRDVYPVAMEAVTAWLDDHSDVESFRFGVPRDSWYPPLSAALKDEVDAKR